MTGNTYAKAAKTVIFAVASLFSISLYQTNGHMRYKFIVLVLLVCIYGATPTQAHEPDSDEVVFVRKKFYLSNSFDGALFGFGINNSSPFLNGGLPTNFSTPRFSYFWNVGFDANYDFNDYIGLFTGVGVKNIGLIEKAESFFTGTITRKRRVYTIGAPLGLKVGNIKKKYYAFLGGGVDLPFHFKEKAYVTKKNKSKYSEWFSDATPAVMPYVFAGLSVKPGIYVKVQYYPNNFFNPNHLRGPVGPLVLPSTPYNFYDVQLLMVSIGLDIRYASKMKIKHKAHYKTEDDHDHDNSL